MNFGQLDLCGLVFFCLLRASFTVHFLSFTDAQEVSIVSMYVIFIIIGVYKSTFSIISK